LLFGLFIKRYRKEKLYKLNGKKNSDNSGKKLRNSVKKPEMAFLFLKGVEYEL
jgi:hypothetical protein